MKWCYFKTENNSHYDSIFHIYVISRYTYRYSPRELPQVVTMWSGDIFSEQYPILLMLRNLWWRDTGHVWRLFWDVQRCPCKTGFTVYHCDYCDFIDYVCCYLYKIHIPLWLYGRLHVTYDDTSHDNPVWKNSLLSLPVIKGCGAWHSRIVGVAGDYILWWIVPTVPPCVVTSQ